MLNDLRSKVSALFPKFLSTPVGDATLFDNGIKTAAFDIDLSKGSQQKVTIDAAVAMTLTPPSGVCTVELHILQGATGGILTFPAGKWEGGVTGTNTTTPNVGYDILVIHFNGGTDYSFNIKKAYA